MMGILPSFMDGIAPNPAAAAIGAAFGRGCLLTFFMFAPSFIWASETRLTRLPAEEDPAATLLLLLSWTERRPPESASVPDVEARAVRTRAETVAENFIVAAEIELRVDWEGTSMYGSCFESFVV